MPRLHHRAFHVPSFVVAFPSIFPGLELSFENIMAPRASPSEAFRPDYDAINLRRALPRLEAKILTPDPRLLRSSYERRKTAAVSHSRLLLC